MEGLNMDNILDSQQVEQMFSENQDSSNNEVSQEENENNSDNNEEETTSSTEVDITKMFGDLESVGSEENNEDNGEASTSEKGDSAPNKNLNSSITNSPWNQLAKACRDEGVFPDLSDDVLNNIKDAGDFRKMIDDQVASSLDERQKRIEKALNNGAEPTELENYEKIINYLNSIPEEKLFEESDEGETLRKQILYQDFINKGFSNERAQKMVLKSVESQNDIEDVKDALESNKDFYSNKYNQYLQDIEHNKKEYEEEQKKGAEALKKDILENQSFLGGVQVDKITRQKAYDNISKPVYRDPDTGQYLTKLQQYQKEHPKEFLSNIALMFTITNNFKDIDKLTKSKVRKELKKGFAELEHTLNNTSRNSDGSLNFASGEDYNDNRESWTLAF